MWWHDVTPLETTPRMWIKAGNFVLDIMGTPLGHRWANSHSSSSPYHWQKKFSHQKKIWSVSQFHFSMKTEASDKEQLSSPCQPLRAFVELLLYRTCNVNPLSSNSMHCGFTHIQRFRQVRQRQPWLLGNEFLNPWIIAGVFTDFSFEWVFLVGLAEPFSVTSEVKYFAATSYTCLLYTSRCV